MKITISIMNLTRSLFTAAEQQQQRQQKLTASCFGSFRLLEGRFPSGIFFICFAISQKLMMIEALMAKANASGRFLVATAADDDEKRGV